MPELITKCGSCGKGEGFKDLPLDYAEQRWPEATHWHGFQRTQCKSCGATFNVEYVDESVREAVDD